LKALRFFFFFSPPGVGAVYIVNDLGDLLVVVHDLERDAPDVAEILGRAACRDLIKPSGVCFHPDGRLLVADTGNSRILAFDRKGRVLQKLDLPDFVKRPSGLTLRTSKDGTRSWLSVCFFGRSKTQVSNPGVAVFDVTLEEEPDVEVIQIDD
jgi:sugar lactone lactonase YvrE